MLKPNASLSHMGVMNAKVIQVIQTVTYVGSGTEEDPNRYITQYWSMDGKLLATNDPCV